MIVFEPKVETKKIQTARIVIKIGSSTITEGGTAEQPLNLTLINNIAEQCSDLFKRGVQVAIVSSGAVASGKNLLGTAENTIRDRQVEAVFGQPALIYAWIKAFRYQGVIAGQMLLTENDLKTPPEALKKALEEGIVIINANDAISDREMKQLLISADNDKLAGFVAGAIGADTLVILTDVEGVKNTQGCIIQDGLLIDGRVIFDSKSKDGTDGMESKVKVLKRLAKNGIKGVIAAAKGDIVLDVVRGTATGCTIFEAKN
ncbi:MAG: hypothetical protein COY68_03515 [Candidatus Levybacteria bacterium CG_4_10_14_0_8_um_filter_35_23]|nr:MAG: hypothetical protein COY68_03515 [Candidatus Levybacteria bacterium CG_4_10_14_0_8_um_filter_35_23]